MKNTETILVTSRVMRIEEYPMSVPTEDEVLIKVAYTGICGSDIHRSECDPFISSKGPSQEIGLGHEFSGIVVTAGAKVTRSEEGDRALYEPGIPCGKYEFYLRGHCNTCPQVDFMATQPNYRGTLTNYLAHPENFTYHLPAHMGVMERALVKPVVVGIHAAELVRVKPEKNVLILGADCIGFMMLQAYVLMGAERVVVADVIERRLEGALQLGAWYVINGRKEDTVDRSRALFGRDGADIVFETAGNKVTVMQSFASARRGREVMVVGAIPGETPVDFLKINREIKVQTISRYTNSFPMAIQAISPGRFDVLTIVMDEYTYEDVQKASEESLSCRAETIRGVIKISG